MTASGRAAPIMRSTPLQRRRAQRIREVPMKNKGLSRRAFLGSALAGSTIAALGLAGCAPSTASQAAAEKAPASDLASTSSNPSFLNAPEPIADADITTTKDADVVIVGCGIGRFILQ